MKKYVFLLAALVASLSFSVTGVEIPEDVRKEIISSVSDMKGSERREYVRWYEDSYISLIERLESSGIPKEDQEMMLRRLRSMYGGNYPKQLSASRQELEDYHNLVTRIKEQQLVAQRKIEEDNQKSRAELAIILENSNVPKGDLENIENNARQEFPENYTLQKAYIKGAIQTYLELKGMIKK